MNYRELGKYTATLKIGEKPDQNILDSIVALPDITKNRSITKLHLIIGTVILGYIIYKICIK